MQFDRELDVKGLNCPPPILRTKKTLSEMASGQVLRVLATDPSAVDVSIAQVFKAAGQQGKTAAINGLMNKDSPDPGASLKPLNHREWRTRSGIAWQVT